MKVCMTNSGEVYHRKRIYSIKRVQKIDVWLSNKERDGRAKENDEPRIREWFQGYAGDGGLSLQICSTVQHGMEPRQQKNQRSNLIFIEI